MKFKLLCESVTTKERAIFYYDNKDNEIRDEQDNRVVVNDLLNIDPCKARPFVGFPYQKSTFLSKLKIQLGLKCNMKCSYCSQAKSRAIPIKFTPAKALANLIKPWQKDNVGNLIDLLQKRGIKIKPGGRVELWGGEPLVYIKTLYKLVPRLRELYPDTGFHMITNGTLLTREIVDWLVGNRVSISISHDAHGYSLRDSVDPLKNSKIKTVWLYAQEQFKKAGLSFGFNVVITKENCDIARVQEYFEKHFVSGASFGFEGIVQPSTLEDIFEPRDAEILYENIKYVLLFKPEAYGNLVLTARKVLATLASNTPIENIWAKCEAPRSDVLTVDLEGNVLSCQNYTKETHKIGDLKDFYEIESDQFNHWSSSSDCKECAVVQFCKGGCPLENNFCQNDYYYHFAIFKAVWFLLFRAEILKIEPIKESHEN